MLIHNNCDIPTLYSALIAFSSLPLTLSLLIKFNNPLGFKINCLLTPNIKTAKTHFKPGGAMA